MLGLEEKQAAAATRLKANPQGPGQPMALIERLRTLLKISWN